MNKKDNVVSMNEYKLKKLFTQIEEDVKIVSETFEFTTEDDLDSFLEMLNLSYVEAHTMKLNSENKLLIRSLVKEIVDGIKMDRSNITLREVVEIEQRVYSEMQLLDLLFPEAQIYADNLIEELVK